MRMPYGTAIELPDETTFRTKKRAAESGLTLRSVFAWNVSEQLLSDARLVFADEPEGLDV